MTSNVESSEWVTDSQTNILYNFFSQIHWLIEREQSLRKLYVPICPTLNVSSTAGTPTVLNRVYYKNIAKHKDEHGCTDPPITYYNPNQSFLKSVKLI